MREGLHLLIFVHVYKIVYYLVHMNEDVYSKAKDKLLELIGENDEFKNFRQGTPDALSTDKKVIKSHWEAFKLRNTAANEIKKIYLADIKDSAGIELDPTDLKVIYDHLDKEALENPDGLKELVEKIKKHNELKARIEHQKANIEYQLQTKREEGEEQKQETRLKELEEVLLRVDKKNKGSTEALFDWTELEQVDKKDQETKKEKLERYGKYLKNASIRTLDVLAIGFEKTVLDPAEKILKYIPVAERLVKTEEEIRDEKVIKENLNIRPKQAEYALDKVRDELEQLKQTKLGRKEMENKLEALRTELFNESIATTVIVAEITRKKLNEKFREILTEGEDTLDSIDKLVELRSKIEKTMQTKPASLDYNKDKNIDLISSDLDDALNSRAVRELWRSIDNVSVLDELEISLKPFLTKDAKTRDFLLKKIRQIIEEQLLAPDKIKLLKILLAKIEIEETEKANSWRNKTPKERIAEFT